MAPIHTILHPTDFSEQAAYALQLACSLARDYGARLVVLHVFRPPVVYGEGLIPPDLGSLKEEERDQLQRLQVPDVGVRAERRLADGDPAAETIRAARELGADLIVMGTHGRTGLGRLLMGSVAEQVVRKAPCPVLTVKTPLPEAAPAPAEPLAASVPAR
jgi:nucleotide-binding universal stress UspA family protein